MNTEDRILRERLTELVQSGRLTGDNLALDEQPLPRVNDDPESEYRPDGYSHETHKGCRRHRLIDERLAEMAESNDADEREAAKDFPPLVHVRSALLP